MNKIYLICIFFLSFEYGIANVISCQDLIIGKISGSGPSVSEGMPQEHSGKIASHEKPNRGTVERELLKKFKNAWNDGNIYESGRCHENIYRFLKTLPTSMLSEVKVLAIFPENRKTNPALSFSQRAEEQPDSQGVTRNFHHVVVYFNGEIFDLSIKSGRPEPVGYYFDIMYGIDLSTGGPSRNRQFDWTNILVGRSIPAQEYLETNERLTYRTIGDQIFPLQRIDRSFRP